MESREQLRSGPSIRIEVFRHDEKDTAEIDETARLTIKGKQNAVKIGKIKNPRLLQGYVVASPRERAMHTAALQFFGANFTELNLAEKDFQTGFEQIKNTLKNEHTIDLDDKFSIDERLNFNAASHPEFNEAFYSELNKNDANQTLDWQKNESDELILNLAIKTQPTDTLAQAIHRIKGFKRMAGDLAEILLEYFPKTHQWAQLYQQSTANYDDPEMDIFICTHSQNAECFLMRLIEMKEGAAYLEKFLDSLPHRKSFIGYSEGFRLILTEANEEPMAQLNFNELSWSISANDLQKMVEERDNFNKEVVKKLNEIRQ